MKSINYHSGQREIQVEANAVKVADRLSNYVGPVADFSRLADLFVFANLDQSGHLQFTALSGIYDSIILSADQDHIKLGFNKELFKHIPPGSACGGLAINLEQSKRARISGYLIEENDKACLPLQTALANCRKYIAPSAALGIDPRIGPDAVENLELNSSRIQNALAAAETAFLATVTPERMPDVSHRGGQPGFLQYGPSNREIRWAEFLGDGMFLSMGNVRKLGVFSILVLDLTSGDGLALRGKGTYTNIRRERKQRVAGLLQDQESFPIQGMMVGTISHASWLYGLCHPRRKIDTLEKVTSRSLLDDQYKE